MKSNVIFSFSLMRYLLLSNKQIFIQFISNDVG